jgi:hypothetical protein
MKYVIQIASDNVVQILNFMNSISGNWKLVREGKRARLFHELPF